MKNLGLTLGIAGTLITMGACNKVNSLENEIQQLSDKEVPAFYSEYQDIQNQLGDYAVDNTVLWKMDSTKAQAMIDEINAGLNKRAELIAKRDSITNNHDVKGYEMHMKFNQDMLNQMRSGKNLYSGISVFSAFFGFIGYMMVAENYREERRRRRR